MSLSNHPLHAAPCAGGTGTATLTFEDLLVEGGMRATDIAPEVVECANLRYSGAIVNAIMQHKPELAMEAYKLASMLPSTATVAELHAEGYMFSERPQVPDEDSVLTLCYRDERVYLIKPLRVDEAARAHTFQAAVAGAPVPHVTPFELVDTARGKHFMILPKYALTLEPLPYLSPAGVTMLWTHMAAALEGLHGRGFVHADVKPSNICLNAAGSGTTAILIDLGSVVRVGTATPSTPTYVPHDLRAPGNNRGSVALDWWMLAVTLADKACGRDHGLLIPVGGVSMAEVRSHLAAHLDPAVWAALAPRLVEEA